MRAEGGEQYVGAIRHSPRRSTDTIPTYSRHNTDTIPTQYRHSPTTLPKNLRKFTRNQARDQTGQFRSIPVPGPQLASGDPRRLPGPLPTPGGRFEDQFGSVQANFGPNSSPAGSNSSPTGFNSSPAGSKSSPAGSKSSPAGSFETRVWSLA